mmetsp:Transcript_12670/g.25863  ORF Transcript_12670/g.25863 Transcript_12670/m.25863 type:complete len:86 (+) Transcript_12670:33-290(+)
MSPCIGCACDYSTNLDTIDNVHMYVPRKERAHRFYVAAALLPKPRHVTARRMQTPAAASYTSARHVRFAKRSAPNLLLDNRDARR